MFDCADVDHLLMKAEPGHSRPIISDSFVIADWTDPGRHPGRPIAGLHLHGSDDEAWIVLAGRLGFRVGEEEREVAAGDSLLVTPGPRLTPIGTPRPSRPATSRDAVRYIS